jgi:hypothetical protein
MTQENDFPELRRAVVEEWLELSFHKTKTHLMEGAEKSDL